MSDPVDPSRLPRPIVAGLSAERERTIARLQDAAVASDDDAFDLDMLDERLELAMKARTFEELQVLTRDLPATNSNLPAVVSRPSVTATASPERVPKVTAIFSYAARRGRRLQPTAMKARAIFGSVVIDLRAATFAPGLSTLRCHSVFGSVVLKVPPHVRVEIGGSGIFGSFEERGESALAFDDSEAPVLHVTGRAIFGSIEVVRRPNKSRRRKLALEDD